MTAISLRMPEDVIEDLKRIAPRLGFSGYQPLIRAYVGQQLRSDLERLEGELRVSELIENLRRRGVDDAVLRAALEEASVEGRPPALPAERRASNHATHSAIAFMWNYDLTEQRAHEIRAELEKRRGKTVFG